MKTLQLFFVCMLTISLAHAQQMWGLTSYGGTFNGGTIVKINADGTNFNVAWNFQWPDGYTPMGDILQATDGMLYGTCFNGGEYASCTCWRFDPQSGNYMDVYDFDITHGDYPTSGMVQADNGMLYGAASAGGASYGGVIYSIDPITDLYSDIYEFETTSGNYPYSAPIIVDGILYGTTVYGGDNSAGVLYSYDPVADQYTMRHAFDNTHGSAPYGGLIQGSDAMLYGMTSAGGANNDGVIYRFDPNTSTCEFLYDFDGTNGNNPKGTLMQGDNGKLYGMTSGGGVNNLGVLFSFDPLTSFYTKLFDFSEADGRNPIGGLMQTGNVLCGATTAGGNTGNGVVFNYDIVSDTYSKVFEFTTDCGTSPAGGFITLHTVTDVPALSSSNALNVFPNPVSNVASCSMTSAGNNEVAISITDLSGKVVNSQTITAHDSKFEVDLADLTSGVYFMNATSSDVKELVKLVKK